ncbi:hypothetical protein DFH07DRAFT_411911 [Mycena maculata]|uniref:DNA2/NAM7 helicase helicase domain-containing protein n=1 Tax=Mycena maculata TaxID=230809 RepID=A0AAD7JEM2_9AGAR|nr:hypothetical protein DFH07DRAFT_411911 [Mycena maculata]
MQTTAQTAIYFPHAKLNASQMTAVRAMLSGEDEERVVVAQGPPGTGKTTVIAAAVLADVEVDFTLIVSKDFHYDWHEYLYGKIVDNVVRSDELTDDFVALQVRMHGSRVVLCTLSMLSNPRRALVARLVPLQMLVVDEASQVEIRNFVPVLHLFSRTLEKLVFIGDDKQQPHRFAAECVRDGAPAQRGDLPRHPMRVSCVILEPDHIIDRCRIGRYWRARRRTRSWGCSRAWGE